MVATIHTRIVHWSYVKSIAHNVFKIDTLHAVGDIPAAVTTRVFEDAI
jgi:hypothetical protein